MSNRLLGSDDVVISKVTHLTLHWKYPQWLVNFLTGFSLTENILKPWNSRNIRVIKPLEIIRKQRIKPLRFTSSTLETGSSQNTQNCSRSIKTVRNQNVGEKFEIRRPIRNRTKPPRTGRSLWNPGKIVLNELRWKREAWNLSKIRMNF